MSPPALWAHPCTLTFLGTEFLWNLSQASNPSTPTKPHIPIQLFPSPAADSLAHRVLKTPQTQQQRGKICSSSSQTFGLCDPAPGVVSPGTGISQLAAQELKLSVETPMSTLGLVRNPAAARKHSKKKPQKTPCSLN